MFLDNSAKLNSSLSGKRGQLQTSIHWRLILQKKNRMHEKKGSLIQKKIMGKI